MAKLLDRALGAVPEEKKTVLEKENVPVEPVKKKIKPRRVMKGRDTAYTFRLPTDVYQKFYDICYENRAYMSDVLNDMILEYLKEQGRI